MPLGAATSARAATCAASTVRVAIVVDLGDGATVTATCVPVASGTNGIAALYERATLLHLAPPRVESGFVCGIDGYPADGCGSDAGASMFWSYWWGQSGSWTPANVGAGTHRIDADIVEGWRFAQVSDWTGHPPNGSPVASATCAADAPPTTAPPEGGGGAVDTAPTTAATVTRSTTTSSGSADAATSTTEPATTTTEPAGATSTTAPRSTTAVTVAAGEEPKGGSGSALGALAGLAAVGGLAAGGSFLVRRRAGRP